MSGNPLENVRTSEPLCSDGRAPESARQPSDVIGSAHPMRKAAFMEIAAERLAFHRISCRNGSLD